MTDSDEPKRSRGRPRMRPADEARRNIGIQVSVELYETIKKRSEESGRSLSREMEFGLEQFFTGTTEAVAQQAIAAAKEAGREQGQSEVEEDFGGRLPFLASHGFAEAFNAELRKAIAGDGSIGRMFRDRDRSSAFADAVAAHIPGIIASLAGVAHLAELMRSVDVGKLISDLEKSNPEVFRQLEARFHRRQEDRPKEAGDDPSE